MGILWAFTGAIGCIVLHGKFRVKWCFVFVFFLPCRTSADHSQPKKKSRKGGLPAFLQLGHRHISLSPSFSLPPSLLSPLSSLLSPLSSLLSLSSLSLSLSLSLSPGRVIPSRYMSNASRKPLPPTPFYQPPPPPTSSGGKSGRAKVGKSVFI